MSLLADHCVRSESVPQGLYNPSAVIAGLGALYEGQGKIRVRQEQLNAVFIEFVASNHLARRTS